MRRILVLLTLSIGVGLMAAPAFGGVVDPQLYVQSLSATCTTPGAACGGDPNIVNPASILVGFAGNHSAASPLLIIVGVPNAGSAPTISLPSGACQAI